MAALCAIGGLLTGSTRLLQGQAESYFEFGRVVGMGRTGIEVQTYDEARRRLVQHSFMLSKETRADKVQVGDMVEVIYTAGAGGPGTGGGAGSGWVLRRVVLLNGGIPAAGPPPASVAEGRGNVRPPASGAQAGAATPQAVTLPRAGAARSSAGSISVNLGAASQPKTMAAVDVPLGVGAAGGPKTMQPKTIVHEMPSEECNRSAADWPERPISLAVLDFRYPTEREESHESGTTGGGSGTAVADLAFARLEQQPEFALSRGDRQKLYRADFAGAARLGRQMGVDAVLAGTLVPIDGPPTADGFPGPRTWELSAGVVDTCTGQLLMRLYSQSCVNGAQPGQAANEAQCRHLTVTAKQAMNPELNAAAFQAPLDTLLYPLEHNGTPAGEPGIRGTVTEANGGKVTLRLVPGMSLRVGEEVALDATRLAKNPATYTLQTLHEQEIGRLTVTAVQGSTITGSFTGEIEPKAGDVAVDVAQPQ